MRLPPGEEENGEVEKGKQLTIVNGQRTIVNGIGNGELRTQDPERE
jgi:hypothetical protein